MDIETAYSVGIKLYQQKSNDEKTLKCFLSITDFLEKKEESQRTEQELRILASSYSFLYLATCCGKKEELKYVDAMIYYSQMYFTHRPDDLEFYDSYIHTLIVALRYEEAYNQLQMLYQRDAKSKVLALKYLSTFVFEAEGLMSKVELSAYEREYKQCIGDAPEAHQQ